MNAATHEPTPQRTGGLLLAGRKVVVTGGARGIGAAVVRQALADGAEVVFSYHRSADTARALCQTLHDTYPDRPCLALPAQVGDPAAVEQFTTAALEHLGGIDVLVNNAGVVADHPFATLPHAAWDQVIDTNLGGTFHLTQRCVLPMIHQRRGAIVNVSSVVGVHGAAGQTNYAAAKAGIIGLTKALAKQVAPFGVTVNAVAPGLIDTDMTAALGSQRLDQIRRFSPAGRIGSPEDVAYAICALACQRANYITGQVLEIAGGLPL